MGAIMLLLLSAMIVVHIRADEDPPEDPPSWCGSCDSGDQYFGEPSHILKLRPFDECTEKNDTCAPAEHIQEYSTVISIGGICNDALPDHDKMEKELRFRGRRFTGHVNLAVYYRSFGELHCATIDDDTCPPSYIYKAPKGAVQAGCHERDGKLYLSFIDAVKLNEFFNTMRLE